MLFTTAKNKYNKISNTAVTRSLTQFASIHLAIYNFKVIKLKIKIKYI